MRRGAAQRRYRRPYRRITWQEMEAVFDLLFSYPLESREVAHVLRRLREARRQVLPVFLQMIQSPDAREREVAAWVLERLGKEVLRPLHRVSTDPGLSEVVRLEIAALLERLEGQRAGMPESEPGVEASEGKAFAVSQEPCPLREELEHDPKAFLQGLEDETILTEVLARLAQMEAEEQERFLERLAATRDERALRLLVPLLSVKEESLLLAVLQALSQIPSRKVLPHLQTLLEETPQRRLRLGIRRAIRTLLQSLGEEPAPDLEKGAEGPPLPFHRAYATEFSGYGEQSLLVSWEHPDGALKVLKVNHSDLHGVVGLQGWERMAKEEFWALIRRWREVGRVPVEVPLAYCREMLRRAKGPTLRRERPLPEGYEEWASPLLGKEGGEEGGTRLEMAEALQAEALSTSGALLQRPEFRTWFLPLPEEAASLASAWLHASSEEEREGLISRLLQEHMTRRGATILRTRLLYQAWLLQKGGNEEEAQVAVLAATALLREHRIPYEKHPFLRALARKTLEALAAFHQEAGL